MPLNALAEEVDLETGEVLEAGAGSKIHILSFDSNNAIVLESQDNKGNAVFAMIDSGEDSYYPGSPAGGDPLSGSSYFSPSSYTAGADTTIGNGHEEEVLAYLSSLGVTEDSFKLYLGTHVHSDHIGSAPQVIMTYKPETVYLPLYADGIMSSGRLFDSQWIYDRALAAADEVGATVLPRSAAEQSINHPSLTQEEQTFRLGQMTCTIINYRDIDLSKSGQFFDTNDYGWGLLVEVAGKRVFIAGDINDYNETTGEYSNGTETAIKDLLAQDGSIDLLVLGHHGYRGSNTAGYLMAIKPAISVQTNRIGTLWQESASALLDLGSAYYSSSDAAERGEAALVATFRNGKDIQLSAEQESLLFEVTSADAAKQAAADAQLIQQKIDDPSLDIPELEGLTDEELAARLASANRRVQAGAGCTCYLGGVPTAYSGLIVVDKNHFYFDDDSSATKNVWRKVDGNWYRFGSDAAAVSGWKKLDGKWYYFAKSTHVMQTGWIKLSGYWYYLDSTGAMHKGWLKKSGKYYYLKKSDGHMLTGSYKVDGYYRYFQKSTGAMHKGWLKKSGYCYYFKKTNGRMLTGWHKIGGYYRYFGGNGKMRIGWKSIGGHTYYFDAKGRMATGTKVIDGKTYRFTAGGKLI